MLFHSCVASQWSYSTAMLFSQLYSIIIELLALNKVSFFTTSQIGDSCWYWTGTNNHRWNKCVFSQLVNAKNTTTIIWELQWFFDFKKIFLPWPTWLSSLEHHPTNGRVTSLTPIQGPRLGCGLVPVRVCMRCNRSMFLFHFDVSLPLSLKSISMPSGED